MKRLSVASSGAGVVCVALVASGVLWRVTHRDPGEADVEARASRGASASSASAAPATHARALRGRYGAHASAVLTRDTAIVRDTTHITLARRVRDDEAVDPNAEAGFRVVLPTDAREPIAFHVGDRPAVLVQELDTTGTTEVVEGSVSYAREGGRAYWTEGTGGYEEWLDVDAGLAVAGRVLASWRVADRRLSEHEGSVLVADASGTTELIVSAPVAYTASGREVRPTLRVVDGLITLEVDAGGEAVLVDPMWVAAGTLSIGRHDFVHETMVVLGNGKALLAGGSASGNNSAVADLYDPATNTWTATASMTTVRSRHAAVALANGNALVCAGLTTPTGRPLNCERYNYMTSSWSAAGSLAVGRTHPMMITLANGNVLIAGGIDEMGAVVASCELYNPTTNTWSTTGSMAVGRYAARTVLLSNGNVALIGGTLGGGESNSIELYNPTTGTWSAGATMTTPRSRFGAARMSDNRVLIAGGVTSNAGMTATEICNATATSCTVTGSMAAARQNFLAFAVAGGTKVVAIGGVPDGTAANTLASTEIFDNATGTWTAGPAMTTPRNRYGGARLVSGKVLVAGGYTTSGSSTATSELFSTQACGDGTLDAGEQCDDGNTATGDCCSASCQYQAAATVCRAAANACDVAETCNATGVCAANVFATNGTACNDGNACTQTDTCTTGVCGGANPVVCTPSDQCHTAGTCNTTTGACSNPSKANGSACNDTNACTQSDTCQTGACVGTNPVSCSASDQCHVAGTCAPATGLCSNPNKANGTLCTDSNACTQTDTCQAGTCAGMNPVTCAASDQCHDPGTCNPGTGTCSNPGKPNGTACNDTNACTQTDTCIAAVCTGASPVVCGASDQCHDVGSCNPGTGVCSNPSRPNGSACNDANACTATDTCQAGNCSGGNPVVCTASDQCHDAGLCNTGTGICSNPNKANGSTCDDGNGCTLTDQCGAGTCFGSNPRTCTALDQCHDAGSCSPVTGTCSNPAKPNGTTCSDANACTQTDACQAGDCTGANPVVCSASDQCHDVGTCNPATGSCGDPAKPNGAPCSDGSACTLTDACQGGACAGGTPVVCTAIDGCHEAGACDPGTGSCSTPTKADGSACDDANGCTQTDTCTSGTCMGTSAIVCPAPDQCHEIGSCDVSTGQCDYVAKANDTGCDDGNACSQSDSCQTGVCTGADPVVCTALDQCHDVGTCDPATGACDDPAKADGEACNDADACSTTDACSAGACVGADPVICTPLDACHLPGMCNPSDGVCSTSLPITEDATCDGVDDDCDSATDEDYVTAPTTCGVGACSAAGEDACVEGAVADSCTPGTPAASDATCDGVDDDCDGTSDEDGACAVPDAGTEDGGVEADADVDAGADGGDGAVSGGACGCTTAGSTTPTSGAFASLLVIACVLARRKRR